MGFRVLGFGVQGLRVWGLGLIGFWGSGFRVWCSGLRVERSSRLEDDFKGYRVHKARGSGCKGRGAVVKFRAQGF